MGSDVDLPQMVPTQEVDSSVVIPELDVVVVTPMTDDVVESENMVWFTLNQKYFFKDRMILNQSH